MMETEFESPIATLSASPAYSPGSLLLISQPPTLQDETIGLGKVAEFNRTRAEAAQLEQQVAAMRVEDQERMAMVQQIR